MQSIARVRTSRHRTAYRTSRAFPSNKAQQMLQSETFQYRAPYLGLKSRSKGAHMTTLSRNARIAGFLYLTLLTAPLRLIYQHL
jgi:hypothetical protein